MIGITVGALAGYFRGGIDTVLMRFTDLFITFPMIVIGAVLGKLAGGSQRRLSSPSRSGSSPGPRWPGWCAASS